MRKTSILFVLLFNGLLGKHYQVDFQSDEFKQRWKGVLNQIGDDAVAVVQCFPLSNGFIMPRQTNAVYYVSGIETPHSYILLDGRNKKVTLYMPPTNKKLEKSEGKVLSASDGALIMKLVGVDQVKSTNDMKNNFTPNLKRDNVIYTMFSPADGQGQSLYYLEAAIASIARDYWDGRPSTESKFVEHLRSRNTRIAITDLTLLIDRL